MKQKKVHLSISADKHNSFGVIIGRRLWIRFVSGYFVFAYNCYRLSFAYVILAYNCVLESACKFQKIKILHISKNFIYNRITIKTHF